MKPSEDFLSPYDTFQMYERRPDIVPGDISASNQCHNIIWTKNDRVKNMHTIHRLNNSSFVQMWMLSLYEYRVVSRSAIMVTHQPVSGQAIIRFMVSCMIYVLMCMPYSFGYQPVLKNNGKYFWTTMIHCNSLRSSYFTMNLKHRVIYIYIYIYILHIHCSNKRWYNAPWLKYEQYTRHDCIWRMGIKSLDYIK